MKTHRLFASIIALVSRKVQYREITLEESCLLGHDTIRVGRESFPLRVSMKRIGLELIIYPEMFFESAGRQYPQSFIIRNAIQDPGNPVGFIRIQKKGDRVVLGSHDEYQANMLNYPVQMDLRQMEVIHDGDGLILRPLLLDSEICVESVPRDLCVQEMSEREHRLQLIRDMYGGPITALSVDESMNAIQQVNALLESEAFRPLDNRGKPGGIVELPEETIPLIIGDLHAQVDNLLTLLSQNVTLDLLEQGKGTLILLGDAVHPETSGELDRMDTSILIMDLIFRLKIRYPEQVFYIRGNHDGFSRNVFKEGVAQCLMWEHALRQSRGQEYVDQFRQFYESLPYVVIANDYVACHAAPIRTRFDREMLINIYQNTGLIRELTSNRLRRRNNPAGYQRNDVKNFKQKLNVTESTQFLVSHSPLNRTDALWREAGRIKNHHIVFSANVPWVGMFTRINGHIEPLSYHQEPVRQLIDTIV